MCLKKLNFPLAMSLIKSFKKDNVNNIAKSKIDFNYDSNFTFYKFYKRYIELKELNYEKCWWALRKILYNVYKNDYDNIDVLNKGKKRKVNYRQFELFDKTDKKLKLDGEQNFFFKEIENREKDKDSKLTALPK